MEERKEERKKRGMKVGEKILSLIVRFSIEQNFNKLCCIDKLKIYMSSILDSYYFQTGVNKNLKFSSNFQFKT